MRQLAPLGTPVAVVWPRSEVDPPQYLKADIKPGKKDAADAEAFCEAVTRPSMRFVPVKSEERQAACILMTVRERQVSVRSQLSNAFRSYAAEFGSRACP